MDKKQSVYDKISNGWELICQYCKKKIEEPAFVVVYGNIITNSRGANVFTCPEQMFNYKQGIVVHSVCWIEMLREYGSDIYDMKKVYEEYNKKAGNKEVQNVGQNETGK